MWSPQNPSSPTPPTLFPLKTMRSPKYTLTQPPLPLPRVVIKTGPLGKSPTVHSTQRESLFTLYETFAVKTEFGFLESVILKLMLPSFPYFFPFRADHTLPLVHRSWNTLLFANGFLFILEIIFGNLKSVKYVWCEKFGLWGKDTRFRNESLPSCSINCTLVHKQWINFQISIESNPILLWFCFSAFIHSLIGLKTCAILPTNYIQGKPGEMLEGIGKR